MIIYQLKNKVNGKSYVGQTVQKYLSVRIAQHKSASSIIGKALAKYGNDKFEVSILATTKSLDRLNKLECYWIRRLDCVAPKGYNIQSGGKNALHTDATKAKMRAAKVGYRPKTPKLTTAVYKRIAKDRGGFKGVHNPFFGKVHSEASKQLIGSASVGRKNTYLTKLNKSRKGSKLSAATREKIRDAKIAWWANRKAAV